MKKENVGQGRRSLRKGEDVAAIIHCPFPCSSLTTVSALTLPPLTMAPKLLPPELLFEISVSISPKKAFPNVCSSSRVLEHFLRPRVVEWIKLAMSKQEEQTRHFEQFTRGVLLKWTRRITAGYPGVNVVNFSGSWKDGLAFGALLHFYRPELMDWDEISDQTPLDRLTNAFDMFEAEFGVAKLFEPDSVCEVDVPDEFSLITYISQLHTRLVDEPKVRHTMAIDMARAYHLDNDPTVIGRIRNERQATIERIDQLLGRRAQ